MNYEEMSDTEIEKEVACIQLGLRNWAYNEDTKVFFCCGVDGEGYYEETAPYYCSNPAQGWVIITSMIKAGHFIAFNGDSVTCDDWHVYHDEGEELRAAMIVYLRMNEDNG